MELWWIILAGCGGGLLLFAYVAFVMYKIFRHRKRMHRRDPEILTDGKDWTVHINEHFERREDGLCMDTLSGSTKLRRKSIIPDDEEAVLQSMVKIKTPVTSTPNNAKDKQDGLQATVGNELGGPKNASPEVVKRYEYTWEKLLLQPSDIRIKRSQTFHYNLPKHRTPMNVDGTTRSLNFDREFQGQRQKIRSKSLRGYSYRESPSNHAFSADENKRVSRSGSIPSVQAKETAVKRDTEDPPRQRSESLRWIPEPDYQSVSIEELVKSGERTNKKGCFEKRSQHPDPVTCEGNPKDVTAKKAKAVKEDKQLSRSESAPSVQAKETVVKREVEEPSRRRSVSLRWIPEPDYQSVSIEELVSASQTRSKDNNENDVCIVDTHSPPKKHHPKVGKLVGTETIENVLQEKTVSSRSSSKEGSSTHGNQNNTSVDFASKFSIPGVAQRMPTETIVLRDQSQEQSNGTVTDEIKNINDKTNSVKNRIQNLESQIPSVKPNPGHNQGSLTEKKLIADRADLATPASNYDSKPLLNSNERRAANVNDARVPNIDNSETGLPSFKKPSDIRSIGKMKIVKNDGTPPWIVNQERTLKHPTRENSPNTTSNVTIVHKETELDPRQSTSELVKAALRNKTKSNSDKDDNNNSAPTMPPTNPGPSGTDVSVTNLPKINQDLASAIKGYRKDSELNVPVAKDADIGLGLEEKKKQWKREQIVDQLHSAQQRNSKQNFIFGTGLAYQSCMPELQNKLKQLTLAK